MSLEEVLANVPLLMKTVEMFASTKDAAELFRAAQQRHIAFGEVLSVADIAANEQHEFRKFFRTVDWDGPPVTIPGPVARFHGTPVAEPEPLSPPVGLDSVIDGWGARPAPSGPTRPLGKPLEGLRVLDLSHV